MRVDRELTVPGRTAAEDPGPSAALGILYGTSAGMKENSPQAPSCGPELRISRRASAPPRLTPRAIRRMPVSASLSVPPGT